jgi:uncharacterized protein
MDAVTFADVVHPLLSFSPDVDSERLVLRLIGSPWMQRLRDISQTANTRLVYMFSEHSRFGHSLGVAFLANLLMSKLERNYSSQIQKFRMAVSAAALLHDLAHLAPGSHTACKAWFPGQPDTHEALASRIISGDKDLAAILHEAHPDLISQISAILNESESLPPWTWEIISGGGWNVDRGNWCIADSILAGVSYGKYNIPALTESLAITGDGHLALQENRLDSMMHFALSRHAMYRQVYQHRVILAADTLNQAIIKRARDLGSDALGFADEAMRAALAAPTASALSLAHIFSMRESWWRYHLMRWREGNDKILSDLSDRLLHRRLFKTVRLHDHEDQVSLRQQAEDAVKKAGYDARYYLHSISTIDVHESEAKRSMLVLMENGRVEPISAVEPLYKSLVQESRHVQRGWIALPEEAKQILGKKR